MKSFCRFFLIILFFSSFDGSACNVNVTWVNVGRTYTFTAVNQVNATTRYVWFGVNTDPSMVSDTTYSFNDTSIFIITFPNYQYVSQFIVEYYNSICSTGLDTINILQPCNGNDSLSYSVQNGSLYTFKIKKQYTDSAIVKWDFGDGSPIDTSYLLNYQSQISHIYINPGFYIAKYNVVDSCYYPSPDPNPEDGLEYVYHQSDCSAIGSYTSSGFTYTFTLIPDAASLPAIHVWTFNDGSPPDTSYINTLSYTKVHTFPSRFGNYNAQCANIGPNNCNTPSYFPIYSVNIPIFITSTLCPTAITPSYTTNEHGNILANISLNAPQTKFSMYKWELAGNQTFTGYTAENSATFAFIPQGNYSLTVTHIDSIIGCYLESPTLLVTKLSTTIPEHCVPKYTYLVDTMYNNGSYLNCRLLFFPEPLGNIYYRIFNAGGGLESPTTLYSIRSIISGTTNIGFYVYAPSNIYGGNASLNLKCLNPWGCEAAFTSTLGLKCDLHLSDLSLGPPNKISYWHINSDNGYSDSLISNVSSSIIQIPRTYWTSVHQTTYVNNKLCDRVSPQKYLPNCCMAGFTVVLDSTNAENLGEYIGQNTSFSPYLLNYYFWDFGDGTTSNEAYPYHIYDVPGYYTICLTIGDTVNCSSTYCRSDSAYRRSSIPMASINIIPTDVGLLEKEATEQIIKAFPNPVIDNFTLVVNNPRGYKYHYELYDSMGNSIRKEKIKGMHTTADFSSYDNGIYLLVVRDDKLNIQKVIKLVK